MALRRSRLSKYRRKESSKQTLKYVVLSVVFIFTMIKWGLPGGIKIISWWTDRAGGVVLEKRNIPLQKPTLSPLAEATFSATIKVRGVAQNDVVVKLVVNGEPVGEVATDDEGAFEFSRVKLVDGENLIGAWIRNQEEEESGVTETSIVLDTELPEIDILSPEDEAEFSGSEQRRLMIRGTVSEEAKMIVNDGFVYVNSNGEFEYRVQLKEGLNELLIRATDVAGNVTEKLLRVSFSP